MRQNVILLLAALLLSVNLSAQAPVSDREAQGLKGPVKSALVTVRDAGKHVVGQPIRYLFDARGNFEHVHYFDTAGNLAITVHYKYDKQGHLVTDTRLREPYSELTGVTNYTYDRKHRTLTGELLELQDTTSFITTSRFDRQGREVEVLVTWSTGDTISRVTKEYDQWGNMLKITYYETKDDLYRGEEVYRYDTEGNPVELNMVNMNRVSWALLYSYHFDERGNWTKCYAYHVTTAAAELYQITTRTITYAD